MTEMTYENRIKAETIIELRDAYIKSLLDIMKTHGDDPTGIAIITASVVMFVEDLNTHLHPNFSLVVAEQLIADANKKTLKQ
jgi:hypothetical protein